MRLSYLCSAGLMLLLISSAAHTASLEDEIEGILIDRTVTLTGYTFVRELGDFRRANEIKSKENLTVYERPSARWGSLIWVMAGNEELYRSFVGPRLGEIPAIAQQASAQIEAVLTKIKLRRILSDKFDLDSEEF